MEKVRLKGKDYFSISDFMEKYSIGSNATVYAMVRDGRAIKDKFMGKVVFSIA